MKYIIFIIGIAWVLVMIPGCLKDDMTTEGQVLINKFYSVDDFEDTGARDGGRNPFHFIISQVEYDPFTQGTPQTAINIQRLDSVKYIRVSETSAKAFDATFDIYNITYFFKDGSSRQSNNIYAESSIGAEHTHIPNTDYNQLFVNNALNYVTLKRGARSENYIDAICGKVKKRFPYIHYFNSDSVGVSTISGDRCTSNVFSYQLITK